MATWLSLVALARRLGRSESTVRSWRNRHTDHVPSQPTAEGRTYLLERMQEIQALYGQGLNAREVNAELERRHGGETAKGEPVASFEAAVLEHLDRIVELLELLAEQRKAE